MFACNMIREGTYPGRAIRTAARYYDCDMDEVAKLVGQRGGRTNSEKSQARAKKKEVEAGKAKARKMIIECIRKHDGQPFFISQEEKRLAEETGFPQSWFRSAREKMREEGKLDWETISDASGHIIGTWFKFFD